MVGDLILGASLARLVLSHLATSPAPTINFNVSTQGPGDVRDGCGEIAWLGESLDEPSWIPRTQMEGDNPVPQVVL